MRYLDAKVSVPLRGFCFSTCGKYDDMFNILDGFRPLTGILFFNSSSSCDEVIYHIIVSVPLRGFCFSTL